MHCQRDLDILVTVTDSLGRKFDNFSSLDFHWSVSDQSLAILESSEDSSLQISSTSSKEGFNYIKCEHCNIVLGDFLTLGDVIIAGEGLQILAYSRYFWPLSSEGSSACHTGVL